MKALHILAIITVIILLSSCSTVETIDMVLVKGGSFYMGSADTDADPDEREIRLVTVEDFYIGKYEVTQAQWVSIMKKNPSIFRNEDSPVECVSWDDAQLFVDRLNKKTGRHYRLPTMEEWEYAALGGTNSKSYRYSGSDSLINIAWMIDNSSETTHRVGLLQANALGIYDMTGNVHEWCINKYDSNYYVLDTIMNKEFDIEDIRVYKGGSWASYAKHCRISNINYNSREMRNFTIGLRLAEDAKK